MSWRGNISEKLTWFQIFSEFTPRKTLRRKYPNFQFCPEKLNKFQEISDDQIMSENELSKFSGERKTFL